MEEDKELVELLESLELRLKRRVAKAPFRSPETLFEELQALKLVIDLKGLVGEH
ncbi:MAG: hypothetical protein OK441_06650 [Thaumarchaeota archaeon]|nr:hypothetical protein [Nitrososphaerota archaeon]